MVYFPFVFTDKIRITLTVAPTSKPSILIVFFFIWNYEYFEKKWIKKYFIQKTKERYMGVALHTFLNIYI